MKKTKLFLSCAGLALASVALASCGGGEKGHEITVWVSEVAGVKELTQTQIKAFNKEFPEYAVNATVEGVSEKDSATSMLSSVEDGADIFCFAQDQLARLVQAGALTKLGVQASADVTAANDAGAVAAATVNGELYCYPLTSDNGYFLIYDKSVVQSSSLNDLDAIIADCENNGKMFAMEVETSGWYNASFFFATGCVSEWTTDETDAFVSVNDTFNSDAGVVALKGMQKVLKSESYVSSSDAAAFDAATPAGALVSGTWAVDTAKSILGDNFGACKLPEFTVDGESYQMGSYSGNKLLGVKPQMDTDRAAALQKLAVYLTSEKCQTERFEEFGWGPSNKNAQQSEAVQNDVALSALAEQNQYAIPQGQIHGSWWDIAKTYASAAKTATTDDELKAALNAYDAAIDGLFNMSEDVLRAFTIVGNINGNDSWAQDFEMVESPEGTWTATVEFLAGDTFKVRQGKSWDVAFPAADYVVETAGTYVVTLVFDGETGTVTLTPAA